MNSPRYIISYEKEGVKTPVAQFYREQDGSYVFRYEAKNHVEFPGFPLSGGEYRSHSLWEAIAFRVPTLIRKQYPKKSLANLIAETSGRLVTDHFEFNPQI